MKTFLTLLITGSILAAAPLAQAQEAGRNPDKSAQMERTVTTEKKVVMTRHWSKGHRLSPGERARLAEVRDYRQNRLTAPPRGYRWVRIDRDYLLISVASGTIAKVVAAR
jgi:Ni/Co efflux regulator RcnB